MSLAQQLAELDRPAPADFDPEEEQLASAQLDADPTAARSHYLEVGPSDLRKSRDTVSDPKYDGVRISRKDLLQDEESHSETQPSDADDADDDDEDPPEPSSDEDQGSDDLQTATEPQTPPHATTTSPHEDDLSSSLKRVREDERRKGKAVARQQSIYDTLVDARIRLQKCLSAVNRLPDAPSLHLYLDSPAAKKAADGVLKEATALADDLFDFQERLLKANDLPETPTRKRRRLGDSEDIIDWDWDEELQHRTLHFSQIESLLHPHAVSTLQKWSNKVLAVDPSALLSSGRNKFSRTQGPKSAEQLIDDALLEREKLLARTREFKGKGERLDPINQNEQVRMEDTEVETLADIFDDTDFYQQLLRDVIDARSGNAAAGNDVDYAQKYRKVKKAVDTRASKGRKLRFDVHEKLQNFMAPVLAPAGSVSWHEAQIDELFASLLGRGLADRGNEENLPELAIGRQESANLLPVLNDGFRVFG